jgi:DNA mismatch endonuclease (patch repair protein)
MDRLPPEKRSWLMGLVRAKNTNPEMAVRRIVFALGFRYRLHGKNLPGRPDIVLASRRSVIFVNGCFWHQHEGCNRAKRPETRAEYWSAKLDENVERDRRNLLQLKSMGWRVLTIWECQLRRPNDISRKITRFLRVHPKGQSAEQY